MSEAKSFKNNFYTEEDFFGILADVRRIREHFKQNKHTMDVLEVIQAREDLAIVNSELGDIGADLDYDKRRTEADYRSKLLQRMEEIEAELIKQEVNPETGKKWTNIPDRARYMAERECEPERLAHDDARRIHARAYFLYARTIPDILNTMASRISFLIRLMPLGQPTEQDAEEATKILPAARNYRGEDDDFNLWNTQRNTAGVMDPLEDVDLEGGEPLFNDIEPEVI